MDFLFFFLPLLVNDLSIEPTFCSNQKKISFHSSLKKVQNWDKICKSCIVLHMCNIVIQDYYWGSTAAKNIRFYWQWIRSSFGKALQRFLTRCYICILFCKSKYILMSPPLLSTVRVTAMTQHSNAKPPPPPWQSAQNIKPSLPHLDCPSRSDKFELLFQLICVCTQRNKLETPK